MPTLDAVRHDTTNPPTVNLCLVPFMMYWHKVLGSKLTTMWTIANTAHGHRKVNMDATDANVFAFIHNMTCCESQQIHKEATRMKKTRRKGVHFYMAFTVSRAIIFTAVFHIHEWPKNNQWCKSRMNHDMTVQTDVKLQNIRPVSDLGPHMEVAPFWNWKDQNPRGLCGLHGYKRRKKQTDLDPFCLV